MSNQVNITPLESQVIEYLNKALAPYFGEFFSDVDCNDIAKALGINVNIIKGAVGSLVKKGILETQETGTGFDVVLFKDQEERL